MSQFKPYYNITLKIGNSDVSPSVFLVRIINSINVVYPTYIIKFRLDPQEFIANKIYGAETAQLSIKLVDESRQLKEEINTQLIIMRIKTDIPLHFSSTEQTNLHPVTSVVTLICVPCLPFEVMTTPVNYLAQNTNPKSPFDAVVDMIDKFLPGVEKDLNNRNANKFQGEQLMVPPMNFAAALDYVNTRYGIFQGLTYYGAREEDGKKIVNLWDIGARMKDSEIYTVYVLGQGRAEENLEAFKKSGQDETAYYTYANVPLILKGQALVSAKGYTNRYVQKPSDQLYVSKDIKAEQLIKDRNVPHDSKNQESVLAPDVKKTRTFHTRDFVGMETDENTLRSGFSSGVSDQFEASFILEGKLFLKNLIRVGEPIKLVFSNPSILSLLGGKYSIKATDIIIEQANHSLFWGKCRVFLLRGTFDQ